MISKEAERKILHQRKPHYGNDYILQPYSEKLYNKIYNYMIKIIPSYWPKNDIAMIKDTIGKITKMWMKEATYPRFSVLEEDIINVIKGYDNEINSSNYKPVKDSWKPPKKKKSKKSSKKRSKK